MNRIDLTFGAEIKEGHGIRALVYNNDAYFNTRIQKLPLGKYSVTVTNNKVKRSDQQNRFLWGVVYPLIAEETGNDVEDLHEYLKRACLPPRFIKVMGENIKIPGSTAVLSKADFVEYIDKICMLSGVEIPSPSDVGFYSEFEDKFKIKR